ncbi:SPOR domain-containing protein [bacterium]|nr:SPOR domain-containing protein [bacterium]
MLSIPISFYALRILTRYSPEIDPLITACVSIAGIAFMVTLLMNIIIRKTVTGLIKEGQAWERSGIFNKARKNYVKALRLYDTFLLWPFSAKKTAWQISGAIAKFNLNSLDFKFPNRDSLNGNRLSQGPIEEENQNFKLSTLVYLKMNPEDRDIAQLWLTWLRKSSTLSTFDQEILSMLAEKYYTDTILSVLILDIFLKLKRKDFTAKKLYQNILKDPELKDQYNAKIISLIGMQEETLELKVSLTKPETVSDTMSEIMPEIISDTKSHTIYDMKSDTISDMKPDLEWNKKEDKNNRLEIWKMIKIFLSTITSYLKTIQTFLGSFLSFVILSIVKIYTFTKESDRVRFYLKAGFLLFISTWLLFLLVNTMSHIFDSRTVKKEKVEIPIKVPKPFTIQVAAYLKVQHAQRYVDLLSKKKIDARIKKVDGGGKIWYVVRVSEFNDKQSATAYGESLKMDKIIEDFFVSNQY